jgi:hypothetical protein
MQQQIKDLSKTTLNENGFSNFNNTEYKHEIHTQDVACQTIWTYRDIMYLEGCMRETEANMHHISSLVDEVSTLTREVEEKYDETAVFDRFKRGFSVVLKKIQLGGFPFRVPSNNI